jgi:hypothetical protein
MNAMRPTRLTTKFTACALGPALGLALGVAVLALPAPARAEDDSVPLDTKIFRGILEGLGLKRDGEAINYQERAPLVIPPSRDLPPPEKADATVANNPSWPNDPDVARSKSEAAQERNRNVSAEREREQNPLRPEELTPGAKSQTAGRRSNAAVRDAYSPSDTGRYGIGPAELGAKGGIFSSMFDSKDDANASKFTGEPPRASLTDPPHGYQTPSPDQPYGLGKASTAPKPTDYYGTHGEAQSGR